MSVAVLTPVAMGPGDQVPGVSWYVVTRGHPVYYYNNFKLLLTIEASGYGQNLTVLELEDKLSNLWI